MHGKLSESDIHQLRTALGQREQRLRYLVQLARQASPSAALRSADNEVFGCEARVWLKAVWLADKLQLACDSESRTVLGLLQLLSSALQGANRDQVRQFDLEAYFHALGLADMITSSRRNGLRHVVQAIQASA